MYRFQVCDLSAIETRVGAWLAGCVALLEVFEFGRDPYIDLAAKMNGLTYDQLWADYTGKNGKERKAAAKRMRQVAKPGILGAIYRLAGGALVYVFKCEYKHEWTSMSPEGNFCPRCTFNNGTVQFTKKTGLWDYADKMGVEMTQTQAHEVVRLFRESYPEICDPKTGIWKQLEVAVADVMHPDHPNTVRKIGPNGCVVIDRINFNRPDGTQERHPMMRMRLPSGRYLHYMDARLEASLMPWKGEDDDGNEVDVYRDSLIYGGVNQKTKKWTDRITTHGGKLFENLVQGIARDVLAVKLIEFEEREMPVVGHVHDEGITLVENDLLSPTVEDMVEIMSKPVDWAPGLLLGADGYEDPYYHK